MRVRLTFLASLLVCMTAAVVIATSTEISVAQNASMMQKDFIIAGTEGYRTQACLSQAGGCGKMMADTWCASKGFKSAPAWRAIFIRSRKPT